MLASRLVWFVALAFVAVATSYPSIANNGLTLIGAGTESVGMGGADVAVARDTTALTSNPAGLSQLSGWAHDGFFAAAFATDVAHADRFGNDKDVSNWAAPIAGGGLSKHIDGTRLTLGMGLFVQAGAGNVYNNLNTPFGGQDTLRAQFGVLKFTPGLAWQLFERLAVGAALNIHYASLKQRVFPNTSVFNSGTPAQTFFGTEIDGASSLRAGAKLGALYKPTPLLSFGLTYSPQVKLPLDNGELVANLSALGLGRVIYRNVQLRGLALPAEIAGGVAWQATPQLLLAVDVMWSHYSRALRTQTLTASNPNNSLAPPSITSSAALDWRNQTVIAAGLAYTRDDATCVYGGVNYGRNPIPSDTLNPLLAVIGELHLTTGFAKRLSDRWSVSTALEYLVPKRVTYYNRQLPFGPGAQERVSYIASMWMLSRRW
jgi:long-chain fatty acid transport protein